MHNKIVETVDELEHSILEIQKLLQELKKYCQDKIPFTPQTQNFITGVNVILEKQEKTLEIISDIKASC